MAQNHTGESLKGDGRVGSRLSKVFALQIVRAEFVYCGGLSENGPTISVSDIIGGLAFFDQV